MLVMDHFNKMVMIVPRIKIVLVQQVTQLFFKRVWVHYGLPSSIIYDCNNKFLICSSHALLVLMEYKSMKRSIAFHIRHITI
jgi:hypothetical protein